MYRARYEDMPHLFPARRDASSVMLEAGPSFDAAVLGWGSYSHLRTEAQRIRALSSFRRYVHGPILLSFCKPLDAPSHTGQSRPAVKRWLKPDSNDFFSVYSGFTHAVRVPELEAAARQSGLKIVHLNEGRTADALSPHAVLVPVDFTKSPEFAGGGHPAVAKPSAPQN